MQHTVAFWLVNCVARWKSCCKELITFFQNEENQILYSMCPLQMRRMMSSGREEMDRLMIGKCFTDQGLDTQIYASYAAHQLWGRRKRKLCFCDRFSNTTDKMILNERNWIVLLLYFIYLCTTDSYLQCVLEGDQNWMILWYWVCYSNCERNKPAMRRTGATNRVKPQEGIAEKKLLEA